QQNLSLALRQLRDHGPQSRARLAEVTRLNKATVSSLVTELVARGLVVEGDRERGEVGRPAQVVRLSGAEVCGMGAEVNVGYVSAAALDLDRTVLVQRRRALSGSRATPEEALDSLAELVRAAADDVAPRTIAGLSVAVPGLVEVATGTLLHAPNLGWSGLPLGELVRERVGDLDLDLHVENEANLAAMAEASTRPGVDNLVLLTGSIGVGAGIVVAGQLLRGASGFGGEVGHMPVELQGGLCGCGRRGCWETRVGMSALLNGLAEIDDPILDPALDTEARLAEVVRRAEAGGARTLNALEQVGTWLGVGAAVLANVLDPQVFILGGYFAPVAPWLMGPMRRELDRRSIGATGQGYALEVSALGVHATVRGAAVVALEPVFDDPTTVPRKTLDQVGA
ncbi:MAG: ROK family protein, partial [Nocardioidaceae bacterium]